MKQFLPMIHSPEELAELVNQLGFLPFFAGEIPGFSVEDCCPSQLWFAPDVDGPWEWKGPVARGGTCIYGKFFRNKAGFISLDWMPDFVNLRRDGYDYDARYDDGLAAKKDLDVYTVIAQRGPILSKQLKQDCNYRKGGNKGFDTVITRLQMQGYVVISDFIYMRDRMGIPYGWGVAKYATPEQLYGYDAVTAAYCRSPQESKERILTHLTALLPQATPEQLWHLMRL
jgi:hypothetical protein